MNRSTLFAAILFMAGSFPVLVAQVTTDPVGFVSVTVPAASDAVLAVPLNRASEAKGVIQSISDTTVTVLGTQTWSANQFVYNGTSQLKTYAFQIASGSKEGLTAKVIANTATTLTLQFDSGDDLIGVASEVVNGSGNGAQFDLIPYWTPGELVPSNSSLADNSQIQIFPRWTVAGQNLSSSVQLAFYGTYGWFDLSNFSDANSRPLDFGTSFVLRNVGNTPYSYTITGTVPMSAHRRLLKTVAANVGQDERIGYLSPIPETIGNIGLGADYDKLLVFNNAVTGFNKAASKVLVFYGGAWYDESNFSDVTTSFVLQPGVGYVYRRKATASPSVLVWSKLQSYLQ